MGVILTPIINKMALAPPPTQLEGDHKVIGAKGAKALPHPPLKRQIDYYQGLFPSWS